MTLYIMLFLVLMAHLHLCKNTFTQGYFKFSDETKMELLVALKAFLSVFALLKFYKSTTFFDSDLEKAH